VRESVRDESCVEMVFEKPFGFSKTVVTLSVTSSSIIVIILEPARRVRFIAPKIDVVRGNGSNLQRLGADSFGVVQPDAVETARNRRKAARWFESTIVKNIRARVCHGTYGGTAASRAGGCRNSSASWAGPGFTRAVGLHSRVPSQYVTRTRTKMARPPAVQMRMVLSNSISDFITNSFGCVQLTLNGVSLFQKPTRWPDLRR